ncbi:MAG: metallophosphoesterase [Candidatus Helarchaeota archaeon]
MTSSIKEMVDSIPKTPANIQNLLEETREIFRNEPTLLKIPKASCLFIGDTHGDFHSSLKVVEHFFNMKNNRFLIFLGDYVDRGAQQLENILFLLLLKRAYPHNVILLRGNHEEEEMNINYGFQHLLFQTFGKAADTLFSDFQLTFAQLPLCVVTWNRIFGVHGGIPLKVTNQSVKLQEIAELKRGKTHLEQFDPITAQLLWSDPKEGVLGAVPSARGMGFFFGKDIFEKFLDINNINLVIRSHEVFQTGYKYFFDKKLISIFSALDYVYLHGIQAKMVKLTTSGATEVKDIVE